MVDSENILKAREMVMRMTLQEYNVNIWPFYLRLENDFLKTLNYVEFSEDNFSTYSIEYEKQLLSICSEVDVLCKLLCKYVDSAKSPAKINEYADILIQNSDITSLSVCFERIGKVFTPFDGWTASDSPNWWKAYNKVKHERTDGNNYKKGNLQNVFMALAGLFVLNRLYCKRITAGRLIQEPSPKSQLFTMVGWRVCIPEGNGFVRVIDTNGSMSLRWEQPQ